MPLTAVEKVAGSRRAVHVELMRVQRVGEVVRAVRGGEACGRVEGRGTVDAVDDIGRHVGKNFLAVVIRADKRAAGVGGAVVRAVAVEETRAKCVQEAVVSSR